jgi:predicted TIM-barrel fold metal-dependent hydrolase
MERKTVDIDGHVAEPITEIMEEYLEPEFKDKRIRLMKDEKGLEYAEVNGRKSSLIHGGIALGVDAGKGFGNDNLEPFFEGQISYYDAFIPASNDPHARIKWLDEEKIDISFVYPTVGLHWEDDCDDPQVAAAYARAYNNWIVDFCKPYPDRLIPIAHIVTKDVEEAVMEVKRTANMGVKGFMTYGLPTNGRMYGDPYFDPLYATIQDTGLPVGIHPTSNINYIGKDAYGETGRVSELLRDDFWYGLVTDAFALQVALINMVNRGTFDRFPSLKVAYLETGGAWIDYWLERMDDRWKSAKGTCRFELLPSEYFQRQGWIAFEPDEELIPHVIERVGADKFFWATDFPHADGFPGIVGRVKKALEPLSEEDQWKVLGENALQVYNIN